MNDSIMNIDPYQTQLTQADETNPDYYDSRNKKYLEKRVKSTGAKRRAKRKAKNNFSSATNNSEAHELESLNQEEG